MDILLTVSRRLWLAWEPRPDPSGIASDLSVYALQLQPWLCRFSRPLPGLEKFKKLQLVTIKPTHELTTIPMFSAKESELCIKIRIGKSIILFLVLLQPKLQDRNRNATIWFFFQHIPVLSILVIGNEVRLCCIDNYISAHCLTNMYDWLIFIRQASDIQQYTIITDQN